MSNIKYTPKGIKNGEGTIMTNAEIIALADQTSSATELSYLDISAAGTAEASKAVVLNSSKGISTITSATITTLTSDSVVTAALTLGATAVASTAAEIDIQCDQSAQTETIDVSTAVSATKRVTKIASTGAGAITLAAPGATMLGVVKVIEMISGAHDVTLALTNVTGGTAATTCTWTNANEALVLVGGTSKWHVIAQSGVVLS